LLGRYCAFKKGAGLKEIDWLNLLTQNWAPNEP
jgi:hypothetical protein